MVERRAVVGGAAVTEEFHPGFRNSTASYTVSLLNPQGDPRPAARRARPARGRAAVRELPAAGRRRIHQGGRRPRGHAARGRALLASATPSACPAYYERLDVVADVLRDLLLETPPNVGGGIHDLFRAWKAGAPPERAADAGQARRARPLHDLGRATGSTAGSSPSRSRRASASTRRRQLREPVRAGLGLRAAAPRVRRGERQEGHVGPRDRRHGRDHAGDARARPRRAASRSAPAQGVARVARARRPRARRGARGRHARSRARCVVSNAHPRALLDAARRRARRVARAVRATTSSESATLRMNVALSELPDFTCAAGPRGAAAPQLGNHHGARRSPSWTARTPRARERGWSREPIVEMLIPSTVDDSLAPAGPARGEPLLPALPLRAARRAHAGTTSASARPTR